MDENELWTYFYLPITVILIALVALAQVNYDEQVEKGISGNFKQIKPHNWTWVNWTANICPEAPPGYFIPLNYTEPCFTVPVTWDRDWSCQPLER